MTGWQVLYMLGDLQRLAMKGLAKSEARNEENGKWD
jgi:hypothetical protein